MKQKLYTLPGAIALVTLYAAFHVIARLVASQNLGEDDPLDNVLAQTLEWGYSPFQPPLYDWILYGLQSFMGTGLGPFLLLKYGGLIATGALLFAITRKLSGHALWGLLAVDALALIYQISWRYHEGFTHMVLAMPLSLAVFWFFIKCYEMPLKSGPVSRRQMLNFALLGASAGLGVLSKHFFWIFLAALFLTAATQFPLRKRLVGRGSGLALVIALLIISPYYIWILTSPASSHLFADYFSMRSQPGLMALLYYGVLDAFTRPFLFLLPYLLIVAIMFPGSVKALRDLRKEPVGRNLQEPDFTRFLGIFFLVATALLILLGPVFGHIRYAPHALNPVFVVMVVFITLMIARAAPPPDQIRRFIMLTLAITVFAFCARSANMFLLDPFCKKCRWGISYEQLAGDMVKKAGKKAVFVTMKAELGGNLRAFAPEARILLLDRGVFLRLSAKELARSPALMVWEARHGAKVYAIMLAWLKRKYPTLEFKVKRKPVLHAYDWHHVWKKTGYRQSRWYVVKPSVFLRAENGNIAKN